MPKHSPLQAVKSQYGSKDQLIDAIAADARDEGEDKAQAKTRLGKISNKKLLRIAEVSKLVKDRHGDRDGLIRAIGDAASRKNDSDYLAKLGTLSSARLLDILKGAQRRAAH